MHCSRTDNSRLIDYSAVVTFDGTEGLKRQIVRRLGKRNSGMTPAQVDRWFSATPSLFVAVTLANCVHEGLVIAD